MKNPLAKWVPFVASALLQLGTVGGWGQTVVWDGGGDGVSWFDPTNWNGNVLPGANDSVFISPGTNTIQCSGNATIKRLQCSRGFTLWGGHLMLTGGDSEISGAFTISGGASLVVTGAISHFVASGQTTLGGAGFAAYGGATISLPALTNVSGSFLADGAGSTVDLSTINEIEIPAAVSFSAMALAGGTVRLDSVTDIVSRGDWCSIEAYGTNSVVNLAALRSFVGLDFNASRIIAGDGAVILCANLLALEGAALHLFGGSPAPNQLETLMRGFLDLSIQTDVTLNNLASVSYSILHVRDGRLVAPVLVSIDHGTASVGGGTLILPALASANDSALDVGSGGKLSAPALRYYAAHQKDFGGRLSAGGEGSVLDLPALNQIRGPNSNGILYVDAQAGGCVRIGGVTNISPGDSFPGTVSIRADGLNSVIDLSALQRFDGTGTNFFVEKSNLTMSNCGIIALPTSAQLINVQVTNSNTGCVSTNNSTLTLTPSSIPADGTNAIAATVTLRDANTNPVAWRKVTFYAVGTISIDACGNLTAPVLSVAQPLGLTDTNGQATATIRATTAGNASIWAIDVTDSVILPQRATAQFTQPARPPPNANLANAIQVLGSATDSKLSSIASLALDEGQAGDYFHAQMDAETAQAVADLVFFGARVKTTEIVRGLSVLPQIAEALDRSALRTFTDEQIQNLFVSLAGQSDGLSALGQAIADTTANYRQTLQQQRQCLLAGAPPMNASQIASYTNDLQLRLGANQVLWQVLQQDNSLLQVFLNASLSAQANWFGPFLQRVGIAIVAIYYPPVGVVALLDAENQHLQARREYEKLYGKAYADLLKCSAYTDQIQRNTAVAYDQVSQARAPNPVTGGIVDVAVAQQGVMTTAPTVWQWPNNQDTHSSVTYNYFLTDVSSVVTLTNTSQARATFGVFALYDYANTAFGIFTSLPLVITEAVSVNPGQSGQVTIHYFDGNNGGVAPPLTEARIFVVGNNDTGSFFVGSYSHHPFIPIAVNQTSAPASVSSKLERESSRSGHGRTSTNVVVLENPIKSYVVQDSTNQTYHAQIWVENPYALPLLATVTQPVPPGITVLTNDGTLGLSSIVWTNVIATSNRFGATFTFRVSLTPGAETNLPPPTVVFTDATPTNNLSLQSVAANFDGLFPVGVSGFAPAGVIGTDVPMQVAITNWTSTNQSGVLTISLTNVAGVLVASSSQPFVVAGSGGTNLTFMLPGSLPLGQYSLTGTLDMNGGTGQVLGGTYIIAQRPLTLGVASPTVWSTNGFNLFLEGPVGSNYLIEAATDLSNLTNWTPILFFASTNSPFYFSDPTATSFGVRFYRAVMP